MPENIDHIKVDEWIEIKFEGFTPDAATETWLRKKCRDLLDMVAEIDLCAEDLTEWEVDFIAHLIDSPPDNITQRQEETIKRIYKQRMP